MACSLGLAYALIAVPVGALENGALRKQLQEDLTKLQTQRMNLAGQLEATDNQIQRIFGALDLLTMQDQEASAAKPTPKPEAPKQ